MTLSFPAEDMTAPAQDFSAPPGAADDLQRRPAHEGNSLPIKFSSVFPEVPSPSVRIVTGRSPQPAFHVNNGPWMPQSHALSSSNPLSRQPSAGAAAAAAGPSTPAASLQLPPVQLHAAGWQLPQHQQRSPGSAALQATLDEAAQAASALRSAKAAAGLASPGSLGDPLQQQRIVPQHQQNGALQHHHADSPLQQVPLQHSQPWAGPHHPLWTRTSSSGLPAPASLDLHIGQAPHPLQHMPLPLGTPGLGGQNPAQQLPQMPHMSQGWQPGGGSPAQHLFQGHAASSLDPLTGWSSQLAPPPQHHLHQQRQQLQQDVPMPDGEERPRKRGRPPGSGRGPGRAPGSGHGRGRSSGGRSGGARRSAAASDDDEAYRPAQQARKSVPVRTSAPSLRDRSALALPKRISQVTTLQVP